GHALLAGCLAEGLDPRLPGGGLGLGVRALGPLGLREGADDEDLVSVVGDLRRLREPAVGPPADEPTLCGAGDLFHDYNITPNEPVCQPPPPPPARRWRTGYGARRSPAARPSAAGGRRGRAGGGRSGSRRCSRPRSSPATPSPP